MRNLIFIVLAFLFFSCTKQQDLKSDKTNGSVAAATGITSPGQGNREAATTFKKFTIRMGAHYCDQNVLSHVSWNVNEFCSEI
jgi:hypothetical protein